MPGRLSLLLRLEQRQPDRVRVSVLLAPQGAPLRVDGVAVELFDADESISTRLILPISGLLSHPMGSTVELRAHGEIPEGARVTASAWAEGGPYEASCPADPCPDLHDHLRGKRMIRMGRTRGLRDVPSTERCRLARVFAWLTPGRPCAPKILEDQGALADEISDEYDLDPQDAAFVRELLAED